MFSPVDHSTFTQLKIKLLKQLDMYNSAEPAGTNSSLDLAGICTNNALHKIYDLCKGSKYTEALPTTRFSSVADQAYIDLDAECYLDDIESIIDTTNQYQLEQRSWWWYRRNFPNPAQQTGVPVFYVRRRNRIYLAPTPSGAVTYTLDFQKMLKDLVEDGDISLLPTHYDYWILAEAEVEWYMMEDKDNVPQIVLNERDKSRELAMDSIFTAFNKNAQSNSHFASDDWIEPRGYVPFS